MITKSVNGDMIWDDDVSRSEKNHGQEHFKHFPGAESVFPFLFSPTESFAAPVNPLKVAQTDPPVLPRFRNGSDEFLTPSSTPKTPSSWPPRPDPTRLGPTCVADHVVSHFVLNIINTPSDTLS